MRWSAAQSLAWIIQQTPLELKQWTSDMGPKIKDAQKELAKAIAAGHVQAWGRKHPHGLVEQIPSDPFRIPGLSVVVGVHGDLSSLAPHKPYVGPVWHFIEFEADEIKRGWPKPPPLPAREWMLKEAQRSMGKRDAMIRDCMKATNCTKRDAEAAYKRVPEGLRRKRGKPPKNAG